MVSTTTNTTTKTTPTTITKQSAPLEEKVKMSTSKNIITAPSSTTSTAMPQSASTATTTTTVPQPLLERYRRAGQTHVFNGIEDLPERERNSFLRSLDSLPLENILTQFHAAKAELDGNNNNNNTSTTTATTYQPLRPEFIIIPGHELKDLWGIGLDAIRAGKVAVVCLAGGQGTRLGSTKPKGSYNIGLPSNRSLFELQAFRLLKLASLTDTTQTPIPWFIMTSEATHQDTIAFFEENGYFGYQKERIRFFKQGLLPSLSEDGRLLLSKTGSLSLSPNGNGGIYEAMSAPPSTGKGMTPRSTVPITPSLRGPEGQSFPFSASVLDDMESLSIDYVHMYCVDNCLVRVCDPYFVGASILKGSDCAAKSILKVDGDESVGVFCHKNGSARITVGEYSEIPKELSQKRSGDTGLLLFNQANIANHFFKVSFLRKSAMVSLPIHLAHKKIRSLPLADDVSGYGDVSGVDGEFSNTVNNTINNSTYNTIINTTDNTQMGYKMEQFIFDIFELATNPVIYQGKREEEFAALKNAPGAELDSPEYCKRMLLSLHRKWITMASADRPSMIAGEDLEISPMVSYAGEGLENE